ncbi:MAG: Gfo/Idh/MocA family protein [Candidatus Odinarchaeota archaeon]
MNVIISFGSIGKRHALNLLNLEQPVTVVTKYPQEIPGINFTSTLDSIPAENVKMALVCSPTGKHCTDVENLLERGIKNILVEKPIDKSLKRAKEIERIISGDKDACIRVAYDMRFLGVFDFLKKFVASNMKDIRIVNIEVGQYLPTWRQSDYRQSYSSKREEGGGVDLDLSHEIDYLLYLFGMPQEWTVSRHKISNLQINSPDHFIGTYEYPNFICTVKLDYIRSSPERFLRIYTESSKDIFVDFISKTFSYRDNESNFSLKFNAEGYFDYQNAYIEEIKEFMEISRKKSAAESRLTTLNESINVLRLLNLE